MNARRVPWWGWLIALFVVLSVLDVDVPVLPFVIVGAVMFNLFARRGGMGPGRRRGQLGDREHGGSGQPGQPGQLGQLGQPGWQPSSPQDSPTLPGQEQPGPPPSQPMPTIDVPRYPGSPPDGGAPPGTSGPGWTSSDPVVSLGQLHLSRSGRDLQRAVSQGTATEQARVLDEIHDLVDRMQGMLAAAAGSSGPGRDAFAAGLRVLDGQVREARGEHPPGAKVTRVVQTCLRMGHTGRHE